MTVRFPDIVDLDQLARATGVSTVRIERYAGARVQAEFYALIEIPKRGLRRKGQVRTVYRVREGWLSELHRMIAVRVLENVRFDDCVQGFVRKRSIRTNAAMHLGARVLLHGDLANFFDTVTIAHVTDAFVALGAPVDMAAVLARCTTIDGLLRQGTRCSPAIANLVCKHLDRDLLDLAAASGARYSRYGDNLTFSGDEVPSSEAVGAIVARHGFALRDGACRRQRRGGSQYVTGLTVCEPDRPRLPVRLKRRLRHVMHFIEKFGIDGHFARAKRPPRGLHDQRAIEGMLRFVKAIEPALAAKLRVQFRAGLAKSRAERPPPEDEVSQDDEYDPDGQEY